MSRRQVSPIRAPAQTDPRDVMIRKLKEDLIVARGREKELAILEGYLLELTEKVKLLAAETAKSDEEGKLKLQLTLKTIGQLKRQVEALRGELRNATNELSAVEEEQAQFKKNLNSKLFELEKLKKEGLSLQEQNQKLVNENYRLRSQEEQAVHEIRKLTETIRNYQGRVSEIGRKVLQVKAYINEVAEENAHLRQKLKGYEHQNTGINNDLDQKENRIDLLEKTFADKHELIKSTVENYIELQHQNEKVLKETKHKTNLVKIENEKYAELNTISKKIEKTIADRSKELSQVRGDSAQIHRINQDFLDKNARLKKDLIFCQQHLQNLIKHNAYIQEEMENYVRQDEAIISVIRRKRVLQFPAAAYSLRTSRNQAKASNRTYQ